MNGVQTMQSRPTAVAGRFYPAQADELRRTVRALLADAARAAQAGDTDRAEAADAVQADDAPVKALIAPHAGYIYSGPIAASAYARLSRQRESITRVVLVGPSHRKGFVGLATSAARSFATPLGDVPLDGQAIEELCRLRSVTVVEAAHATEHSLEVHLPFLIETLGRFELVPLVFGDTSADDIAAVLRAVWGGPETLIVISSDLSHYHDHATACRLDRATAEAIEAMQADALNEDGACGCLAIQGLLQVAVERGLRVRTVDLRTSGDTAGPRDQVVGYGAWALTQPANQR